ncbi:MAG: hypothetical protein H6746_05310 [Deltaproteobacteria bacterium]|nr:hypothetical protein [Deltaproteobacteria bacterium]
MTHRSWLAAVALVWAGCAGGDTEGAADVLADVLADVADALPDGVDAADVADGSDDAELTAEVDSGPPALETPTFSAYAPRPTSILPPALESCAVIRDTTCTGGTTRTCALYDTVAGEWAAEVPPMTEQAFVFDRYFDRYHQANGQSMDLRFTRPVLAGTPEAEWSKPEYFERYDGFGDASGWTGTALWAAAARYQVTGTPADYQRMLGKLEAMAFMYEVTDVPGLLARSHWAMLPEGAPRPLGHWGESIGAFEVGDGKDGHFSFPIAERFHDRLPTYYLTQVTIDGQDYPTTPRVQSDASRDMYVRSLPGILLAWDMLAEGPREDAVRATLREEIPCTLNRMKKGHIIHLQENPDVLEAVTTYFAGPHLQLDPGDLDFAALDELVFYVLEQPSPLHLDAFDRACPSGPPRTFDPALELDAADPLFLLRLAELASREQRQGEVPIQFSMHVSIRASDALFISQWALTAHYLTGDTAYLDFLAELMASIPYQQVLDTLGAFQLPRWCAPHYAPSITYPSLYNVLARVDREAYPVFWRMLSTVARVEGWDKENGPRDDAFWGILYGRMVTAETDPQRDARTAGAVALLATYGMNPDDKLEPDRSYPRNFVDHPDPEITLEEIAPGDPEWALCEEPVNVLGLEIPAPKIDGIPIRAVDPLPLAKRIGGTLLWQMDPWMVQREYGGVGMDHQWPMLGMFTPYWIGRSDGLITEGRGLALAWKDTGAACAP